MTENPTPATALLVGRRARRVGQENRAVQELESSAYNPSAILPFVPDMANPMMEAEKQRKAAQSGHLTSLCLVTSAQEPEVSDGKLEGNSHETYTTP